MWRQKLIEITEGDNEKEELHVRWARGERARQAEDNIREERETRLEKNHNKKDFLTMKRF